MPTTSSRGRCGSVFSARAELQRKSVPADKRAMHWLNWLELRISQDCVKLVLSYLCVTEFYGQADGNHESPLTTEQQRKYSRPYWFFRRSPMLEPDVMDVYPTDSVILFDYQFALHHRSLLENQHNENRYLQNLLFLNMVGMAKHDCPRVLAHLFPLINTNHVEAAYNLLKQAVIHGGVRAAQLLLNYGARLFSSHLNEAITSDEMDSWQRAIMITFIVDREPTTVTWPNLELLTVRFAHPGSIKRMTEILVDEYLNRQMPEHLTVEDRQADEFTRKRDVLAKLTSLRSQCWHMAAFFSNLITPIEDSLYNDSDKSIGKGDSWTFLESAHDVSNSLVANDENELLI